MSTGFSQSTCFIVTNILLSEISWSVLFTIYLIPLSFSASLLLCDNHDLKTAVDHDCKLHLYIIKLRYFAFGGDFRISKKFTSLDFEIAYM
jgi:hypothetical protein